MPELTSPDERSAEPTVVELPTEAGSTRVMLPANADEDEVAALIAAVTARLREDATEDADAESSTDAWKLACRFRARRRYELPRECRQGGEWRAAARRPRA
jgi:hypothetical protein